jgi:hypothetical protein
MLIPCRTELDLPRENKAFQHCFIAGVHLERFRESIGNGVPCVSADNL